MRRRLQRLAPWWRRFERNGYRRERCEGCGHPFRWSRDPRHSLGNRDGKVWHGPCLSLMTTRAKADERLEVLDLVCDVWEIDDQAAKGVVENRATTDDERVAASNRAFRVFHDLSKRRAATPHPRPSKDRHEGGGERGE